MEQLWRPDPEAARRTQIADFARWLATHRAVPVAELDYAPLHRWSVENLADFWSAAAEYLGVRFSAPAVRVLGDAQMPGAQWFPAPG